METTPRREKAITNIEASRGVVLMRQAVSSIPTWDNEILDNFNLTNCYEVKRGVEFRRLTRSATRFDGKWGTSVS